MADNGERAVFNALQQGKNKYAYFILAVAAAAITLAVNQTHDAVFSLSQIPLAFGVLCWAASFYCGCRHLDHANSYLDSNFKLIQHQKYERFEDAKNAETEIHEKTILSNQFADRQFQLVVTGSVLYVVWHVIEMWLRTPT